jgi:hypothetical protein
MSALSETHSLAGGGCSQESNGQRCSPVLKSMSLSSIRSSAIKDNSMTGGEPVKTTEAMTSTAAVMIDERHVWLFKCITLGFGIQDDDFVQRVEKYMSSGKALEFVNIFLAPNSPRALFALLSHGTRPFSLVASQEKQMQDVVCLMNASPLAQLSVLHFPFSPGFVSLTRLHLRRVSRRSANRFRPCGSGRLASQKGVILQQVYFSTKCCL